MTKLLKQVQDLADQGYTYKEASEKSGIKYMTLSSIAHRHNIKFRKGYTDRAPAGKVKAMLARGMNQTMIAKELGVSKARISQVVKQNGLKPTQS